MSGGEESAKPRARDPVETITEAEAAERDLQISEEDDTHNEEVKKAASLEQDPSGNVKA